MLDQFRQRFLTSVRTSTTLDIPDGKFEELSNNIGKLYKRWPKRTVDLLGGDQSKSWVFLTHLNINHIGQTEDPGEVFQGLQVDTDFSIHEYQGSTASNRRQLRRHLNTITELLLLLGENAGESHFHCRFFWTFDAAAVSPIVNLPLLKLPVAGTPFEQISGVRFTAPSSDNKEYAILDLDVGGEEIFLNAYLAFFDTISPDLLEVAIVERDKIQSALIPAAEKG